MKYILKNLSTLFFLLVGASGLVSCFGSDGINGANGIDGDKGDKGESANCDVEEDGTYYVMKCGKAEKARWGKAMCGKTAYDPAVMECKLISEALSFRFADSRDGKVYKAVIIGSQTWMAENLSYAGKGGTLGKCYNDSITNCYKYGRLYNWETAIAVCPDGWHLPTDAEWNELYRSTDGNTGIYNPYYSPTAGKYLKSKICNGTDIFGFTALPSGRGSSDSSFYDTGSYGYWWSATEYSSYHLNAHYRNISCDGDYGSWSIDYKLNFYSVRCVKG